MKKLCAVLCVVALPLFANPPAKSTTTKTISHSNPAGSHTMTITKSGTGQDRTVSKTVVNTEGNKTITKSSVHGAGVSAHKHHKKTVKTKSHKKASY